MSNKALKQHDVSTILRAASSLKGFVNNIIIHQVTFDGTEPQFHIPPLPEHGLFFYIKDRSDVEDTASHKKETLSPSLLIGPHVNRHIIRPGRDHLMIKVGFQPGGLYRFSGIPMTELVGYDSFDAVDLLGKEMNEVTDQLREADSFSHMKLLVERFLLKHINRLKPTLPIDRVLPLLIKERGLLKIDQLASHACLSTRQFERVFGQRIGLPPNTTPGWSGLPRPGLGKNSSLPVVGLRLPMNVGILTKCT